MKLLFICGSLEAGRDGVGDYCTRLSLELVRQGHAAAAIALNDSYATEICESEREACGSSIPILRLPSSAGRDDGKIAARKFIASFSPDVISLQFVPYGFNKKGLPFGLAATLAFIAGKATWHFMFHEIWLSDIAGWKQVLVKFGQQQIVKSLYRSLRPKKVHCSITINQDRLWKQAKIRATVLPLFGNIGFSDLTDEAMHAALMPFGKRILYFGTAPKGEFLKILVQKLRPVCDKYKNDLCIVVVGFNSPAKTAFLDILNEELSDEITVLNPGFLSESSLAFLMRVCSVGVARSDPFMLGKSGTAIAMLEFGMPIWLPKLESNTKVDYQFRQDLIFDDLDAALQHSRNYSYHGLLADTATQLIQSFN